jgi:hypothetical protein
MISNFCRGISLVTIMGQVLHLLNLLKQNSRRSLLDLIKRRNNLLLQGVEYDSVISRELRCFFNATIGGRSKRLAMLTGVRRAF